MVGGNPILFLLSVAYLFSIIIVFMLTCGIRATFMSFCSVLSFS
jgi:hypothetical protein